VRKKLLIHLLAVFTLLPSLASAQTCNQGQTCCPYGVGSTCNVISYTYCTLNGKVVNCDISGTQQHTAASCCTCPGNPDECSNAAYYSIYSQDGSLVVDPGGCAAYDPNTQQPSCVSTSEKRNQQNSEKRNHQK